MSNQNGASREEAIEHYGIKGMKWGVRRTDEQLARANRRSKGSLKRESKYLDKSAKVAAKGANKNYAPNRTRKIKEARARAARDKMAVNKAALEYSLATTNKGRKAAAKELEKSYDKYINSPDLDIGNKMTRGEKAFGAIAITAFSVSAGSLAPVVGGVAGGTLAVKGTKRRIEKDRKRFNEDRVMRI